MDSSSQTPDLLNAFSPAGRLYRIEGEGAVSSLAVEAWLAREALSELSEMRVIAASTDARLALKDFIGQRVTLFTRLADGGEARRSGLVRSAEKLGADGTLARYRLTVVPWLWLATQQRHSQVFQDRTLADIIRLVLAPYAPFQSWRLTANAQQRIDEMGARLYVSQYRETDYAFLSRLLAEAGLGFAFVEDEQASAGHAMTIFADSAALPEDPSGEVRYHRTHSQEEADAIQYLACHTRVTSPGIAVVAWDHAAKRSLRAHAPAKFGGSAQCPDSYLSVSQSVVKDEAGAQRLATQLMESIEARAQLFAGRGSVRTYVAGTRTKVADCPHLPSSDGAYPLLLEVVEHCGINNLVAEARTSIDSRLGRLDDALMFDTPPSAPENGPQTIGFLAEGAPILRRHIDAKLLAGAREQGYANAFRAINAGRPWRPRVVDASGARLYAGPTVAGVHTARVVGPEGETSASGAEHYASPRGEIRIRFPWQKGDRADDRSTGWVRAAQRQAGAGMGWQWLPRIGQEVLVKFVDDDIDQPVVVGALYNGQGEGGIAPSPGGKTRDGDNRSVYQQPSDTAPTAQANLAGGAAPAWHGMSPDEEGHRNAAAMTGFKSREHGSEGFNQLVFDDSDQQLRTQLATTQHFSQLTLGHLVHQQDNTRGSLRGHGFELRTDGYGAVRGQAGVLVTTYHDGQSGKPLATGDNAAGIALIRQARMLTRTLGDGAVSHQAPALSVAKSDRAPLGRLEAAVQGMVDGKDLAAARADATARNTSTPGKVPAQGAAIVHLNGRAGFAAVAGQHLQIVSGESISLTSGEDTDLAVGGQARWHAKQAFGIAAALEKAGDENTGIRLIAGEKDVDMQAQHDVMKLQSQKDMKVVSSNASVDFAAARRIRVATAGGASITIEGGNITVEAPGAITYKTAQRKFEGPANVPADLPLMPNNVCKECLAAAQASGVPFAAR
ncbi:type VI secretion system Vgr family protein [Cupriavidus plantarum]|uniref:type VI secretion system Vgr family protein n=1 Tax=Cupriavidus plantarum TaxID=942865 RepID=UPI000E225DE7|nr:type VI secretion system Vgr family protein [Cupriavidus plantarum]REE91292.1 uncharacterized protein involved in type VI secretion and phage assembly [Cupriavidus plantarum]